MMRERFRHHPPRKAARRWERIQKRRTRFDDDDLAVLPHAHTEGETPLATTQDIARPDLKRHRTILFHKVRTLFESLPVDTKLTIQEVNARLPELPLPGLTKALESMAEWGELERTLQQADHTGSVGKSSSFYYNRGPDIGNPHRIRPIVRADGSMVIPSKVTTRAKTVTQPRTSRGNDEETRTVVKAPTVTPTGIKQVTRIVPEPAPEVKPEPKRETAVTPAPQTAPVRQQAESVRQPADPDRYLAILKDMIAKEVSDATSRLETKYNNTMQLLMQARQHVQILEDKLAAVAVASREVPHDQEKPLFAVIPNEWINLGEVLRARYEESTGTLKVVIKETLVDNKSNKPFSREIPLRGEDAMRMRRYLKQAEIPLDGDKKGDNSEVQAALALAQEAEARATKAEAEAHRYMNLAADLKRELDSMRADMEEIIGRFARK